MPLPPQKFREAALQVLFMSEYSSLEDIEVVSFMMKELKTSRREVLRAIEKVVKIRSHQRDIDALIQKLSEGYSLERISRSEKVILRLGLFELLFEKEVSPKITIAEGIRLCRKFGTRESAQFVNAILDKAHKLESLSKDEAAKEPESV